MATHRTLLTLLSPVNSELGLLFVLHSWLDLTSYYYDKEDGRNAKAIDDDDLLVQLKEAKVIDDDAIVKFLAAHRFTLKSHCNGLLCFIRFRYGNPDYEIFIHNPLSREAAILQQITAAEKPMHFIHNYSVGFSPSTKEYKVVRVCTYPSFHAMIYTLGTTSWRDVVSSPPYPIYGKPVYADGALHWKTDTNASEAMEHRIVSFNIEKEEFFITNHPNLGSERNDQIDIIEFRGCLAIVYLSFSTHIEIWVMKDNINQQWVKEYSIKIQAPDGKPVNSDFKVIGIWEDGEILLSLKEDQFLSYDPETDNITYILDARLRKIISEKKERQNNKAYRRQCQKFVFMQEI